MTPQVETNSDGRPEEAVPLRRTIPADALACALVLGIELVFLFSQVLPAPHLWMGALALIGSVLAVYGIVSRSPVPHPRMARGVGLIGCLAGVGIGTFGAPIHLAYAAGVAVLVAFFSEMLRANREQLLIQVSITYLVVLVGIAAGFWPHVIRLGEPGRTAGLAIVAAVLCMAVARLVMGRIWGWWPFAVVAFAGLIGGGLMAWSLTRGFAAFAPFAGGVLALVVLFAIIDFFFGLRPEAPLPDAKELAAERQDGEGVAGEPQVGDQQAGAQQAAEESAGEIAERQARGHAPVLLALAGLALSVVSAAGAAAFGLALAII